MIKDLFINACILIAFISIANQIFKNTGLNPKSPLKSKLLYGAIMGFLSIILMIFSVRATPVIFVDFRNIPVILSAIYGGPIPVVLAGSIVGLFRVFNYGITASSLAAFIVMFFMVVGCASISKLKTTVSKKWVLSVSYSLIVSSIAFSSVINDASVLWKVLIYFWIGTSVVALLLFGYIGYLEASGKMYRRFKEEAEKDFITGLNNVRQFDSLFNQAINAARENNEKMSLLFIDLDHFKRINDTFGHPEGDIVLRELGKILLKTCRSFDIVSRNGGEEFSVILPGCPAHQAIEVAERIRSAVEMHEFKLSSGKSLSVTISIGTASYPETVKEPERLIECADAALYKAKCTGRNRVVPT